jgi:hypothetical protein
MVESNPDERLQILQVDVSEGDNKALKRILKCLRKY